MKNITHYSIFFIILLSLTISGCTRTRWVSDVRSADLFERDRINCLHWANQAFPLRLKHHWVITNGTELNNTYGYRRWDGIRSEYIDINKEARNIAFKKCMMENDWREEEY